MWRFWQQGNSNGTFVKAFDGATMGRGQGCGCSIGVWEHTCNRDAERLELSASRRHITGPSVIQLPYCRCDAPRGECAKHCRDGSGLAPGPPSQGTGYSRNGGAVKLLCVGVVERDVVVRCFGCGGQPLSLKGVPTLKGPRWEASRCTFSGQHVFAKAPLS